MIFFQLLILILVVGVAAAVVRTGKLTVLPVCTELFRYSSLY